MGHQEASSRGQPVVRITQLDLTSKPRNWPGTGAQVSWRECPHWRAWRRLYFLQRPTSWQRPRLLHRRPRCLRHCCCRRWPLLRHCRPDLWKGKGHQHVWRGKEGRSAWQGKGTSTRMTGKRNVSVPGKRKERRCVCQERGNVWMYGKRKGTFVCMARVTMDYWVCLWLFFALPSPLPFSQSRLFKPNASFVTKVLYNF